MRIQLIAQGSTPEDRRTEDWGVAFLIGEDLLFDTFGKPAVFLKNCEICGIDLKRLRHVVISHDDWDHIAGLQDVLRLNSNVDVFLCPHANTSLKTSVAGAGALVIEAGERMQVCPEVYTSGELIGNSSGRLIYEQALVIESTRGLALLTGCAHPGIVTLVAHVQQLWKKPVQTVIGGLHLKDSSSEAILETIKKLKALGVAQVAPIHCTGAEAVACFQNEYQDGFVELCEGDTIEL
jgi:7,8-dihydropterin-6-yl-methyl-4-(beta-D-ribofuranosyl)aminobenzene 5'-phosphate synthase